MLMPRIRGQVNSLKEKGSPRWPWHYLAIPEKAEDQGESEGCIPLLIQEPPSREN